MWVRAPGKKTRLVNGPGSGRGSWPTGRIRVWKNPARTRPVAIPTSFSFILVKHILREGNCVAHKLARRAINNPFLVWMESVPPNVLDVYQLDLLKMH